MRRRTFRHSNTLVYSNSALKKTVCNSSATTVHLIPHQSDFTRFRHIRMDRIGIIGFAGFDYCGPDTYYCRSEGTFSKLKA